MKKRTLSPMKMFAAMADKHVPHFRFSDFTGKFSDWKAAAVPPVLATLGDWPATVDPEAELVADWVDRDVRKRRYLIEVAPGASASLQVNSPAQASSLPAILCWHGHGPHGKDAVMGNEINGEVAAHIREYNYDYGHQMASAGFVTYAIDWMGCGERNDAAKPHFLKHGEGRDWCNLYYLNATMLGMTSLSINLAHGRAATDFICTLPEVDASRLGVMGLSGGGTMAVWSALTDARFCATEIICYSDLWAKFGIEDLNYCGMQVAPGLFKLVDLPDLQGLLAPRPLLVDIGSNDRCFLVDNAMECHRQVRAIYEAAQAGDKLELDLFPGGHAWGGRLSANFFGKYLGAP